MRFELSFLALIILFQNISSNKYTYKQISKASLAKRKIVQNKEKTMRKLQEISEHDSAYIYTIPTDLPPEAEKTTSPPITIDNTNSTTKPPEQSQETTSNTGTALQIKKFHNYKRKSNAILFNVFFYFLNRPIIERIFLRLSIMYRRRRLRNLDDTSIPGESVATPCVIKSEYKGKLGTFGAGDNVDYECTTPTQTDAEIESAIVDTSFPMVVGNETIEFSEVRFEPDALKEASNIADEKVVKELKVATFDNVTLNLPMEKNKFKMSGKLIINDGNIIQNGKSFNMKFYDISKGDYSNSISCVPTCAGEQCDIECDTTDNPLRFYVRNLTIAKYDGDSNTYISINTEGEQDDRIVSSMSNSANVYRKNSSGLSGGAIAGIVIACVVVLAAASIAAIMLRKPSSPPIDNTTVIGLKNVENL